MKPRTLAAATALSMVVTLTSAVPTSAAPEPVSRTYTNAVSQGFADTFADPVIIRGKDGYWYSYGTSDPLRQAEKVFHRIPMARSTDLVHWQYVGDALSTDDIPPYAEPDTSFWVPDVRYLDGRYVMYFTVTDTTAAPGAFDFAIGAATAPTPAGPWTVSPEPVVAPRPSGDGRYFNTIDPAQFTDVDGRKYLYFGATSVASTSPNCRPTASGRWASRPASPSGTATRVVGWSDAAATTTSSARPRTAALARPPDTRCSPAARPALGGPSWTVPGCR